MVKISGNHSLLLNTSIPIVVQAKCLGYQLNKSLSAKTTIEENIAKARRQFFALGSTGCYIGHSNPLTARVIVETCVTPTLLYGAENWILDDVSLNLLEGFQAEIGRHILRLSRFHSCYSYSVLLALSWPSMKARAPEVDNIASRTFRTLASQDVYSIGIVQQCLSLDSKVGTQSVTTLLNNTAHLKAMLKETKKEVLLKDEARTHQEAAQHQ